MKISLKRKIGMTAIFAGIYVAIYAGAAIIVLQGIVHLVACGLLAIPFGWMIGQTWRDD